MPTPRSQRGGELTARPPHQADEKSLREVRTMAACGLSEDQICRVKNITMQEFEACYRSEFNTGALKATVQVGSAILSVAVDRNHPQFFQCASFWQRARAGWRDVRAVETESTVPELQKQQLVETILERLNATPSFEKEPEKVKK